VGKKKRRVFLGKEERLFYCLSLGGRDKRDPGAFRDALRGCQEKIPFNRHFVVLRKFHFRGNPR